MTKLYKPVLIILAVLCAVLGVISANSLIRATNAKNYAAKIVFYSLRTIDERLENLLLSGEYTVQDSEKVLRAICEADMAVRVAEKLYPDSITNGNSFFAVGDALGCSYFANHNGVSVESVLYDGEISKNELKFITELEVDIYNLLLPMYREDGMNIRSDLTYSEIRQPLSEFLKKWGFWAHSSDAPYELLDSDEPFVKYIN